MNWVTEFNSQYLIENYLASVIAARFAIWLAHRIEESNE